MADPRWWTVPDPSLVINDVIITPLPLLKVINVLANFCIQFLHVAHSGETSMEFGFCK